jgi:hypothetical protein
MQAKNRIPPRLLTDTLRPKHYRVKITLPNAAWVDMQFSQKDVAQLEYNRIKAASIFGGQWIQTITLEEVNPSNE